MEKNYPTKIHIHRTNTKLFQNSELQGHLTQHNNEKVMYAQSQLACFKKSIYLALQILFFYDFYLKDNFVWQMV